MGLLVPANPFRMISRPSELGTETDTGDEEIRLRHRPNETTYALQSVIRDGNRNRRTTVNFASTGRNHTRRDDTSQVEIDGAAKTKSFTVIHRYPRAP
jgi:hypothetical protein